MSLLLFHKWFNVIRVEFTFVRASGERIKAKGKVGDSLLDVIVNSNLDFDGFGACEGTLTCSTCHLIFSKPVYEKIPEKPSDDELDMLDLAFDLTDTSRLGCQIYLSKDMNGIEVKVCDEQSFSLFKCIISFLHYRFQLLSTMRGRKTRCLGIQSPFASDRCDCLLSRNINYTKIKSKFIPV